MVVVGPVKLNTDPDRFSGVGGLPLSGVTADQTFPGHLPVTSYTAWRMAEDRPRSYAGV